MRIGILGDEEQTFSLNFVPKKETRIGILGDEGQTFSHLSTSQNPNCLIQTQDLARVYNQREGWGSNFWSGFLS